MTCNIRLCERKFLCFQDLVELCLNYMPKHLAKAVKHGHLVSWLQYTMACGHSDVAKVSCVNFLSSDLYFS